MKSEVEAADPPPNVANTNNYLVLVDMPFQLAGNPPEVEVFRKDKPTFSGIKTAPPPPPETVLPPAVKGRIQPKMTNDGMV